MDFVLALHSHLPYVLNHGRWPHGSDWLCEAAIDCYLPLLLQLEQLESARIPAPLTLGITPVLANQLQSPVFREEFEAYLAGRLGACTEAETSLARTGESHLVPLVRGYAERLDALRGRFRATPDLTGAFCRLEQRGRLELIGSAATHAFLPLLSRDQSIRLQLLLGREEHRRIFGRAPRGLWLPECAYGPGGMWAPLPARAPERRAGLERFIGEAGFEYFFVDSHMAEAGTAIGGYGPDGPDLEPAPEVNSPYRAYRVAGEARRPLTALVRDPVSTRQVWSRHLGYPGDQWYREFHRIRWPEGLRLWRVSAPGSGLGDKHPYQPARALEQTRVHAQHFASLLRNRSQWEPAEAVLAVPFDTELFGHWWFEGPQFLGEVFRALAVEGGVRTATGTEHLHRFPAREELALHPGSWGAGGDFRMWLNPGTEWTWARLWGLEDRFWRAVPEALKSSDRRRILAQAARELLLAMASDWQFIISTGQVADYGTRRFTQHCDDAEYLIAGLAPGASRRAAVERRAAELWQRDQLFPEILEAVGQAVA